MSEAQLHGEWWVYIVECCDGSLYTGIAKNVTSRVAQHNKALGARYTRARLPVKLLYAEPAIDHSAALKREHQIKKMPRKNKLALLQNGLQSTTNPS